MNKFLSARFLVTVMITITFCIIALKGKVSTETFMTIFSTIVTFYFAGKKRIEDNYDKPKED